MSISSCISISRNAKRFTTKATFSYSFLSPSTSNQPQPRILAHFIWRDSQHQLNTKSSFSTSTSASSSNYVIQLNHHSNVQEQSSERRGEDTCKGKGKERQIQGQAESSGSSTYPDSSISAPSQTTGRSVGDENDDVGSRGVGSRRDITEGSSTSQNEKDPPTQLQSFL